MQAQRVNHVPDDYQQTTSQSIHSQIQKEKYTEENQAIENALDNEFFQESVDVDGILGGLGQEDVIDLVMGKKVQGIKLDKFQRRELKFAIKRDAETEEIMGMLAGFVGSGDTKFINTKRAAGQQL